LKEENARLARELSLCTTKLNELQSRNSNLTDEFMKVQARAEILKGSGMPPTLRKETDRVSMLNMIGDAILFILNVIMYQTQPITRLRALCTVLFENELYGAFATQKVEKEISTRYARKHVFFCIGKCCEVSTLL
jgi:hypothetical protein